MPLLLPQNVTAVDPEATFLDDFDPVASQEEYRYYMPDRLKASEAGDTSKYFRWGQYVLYSNPRLQHGRIELKQYGQQRKFSYNGAVYRR